VGKGLCNRFADAHRSSRYHHNFFCEFHARVVFPTRRQVKMRGGFVSYNLRAA